MKAHTVLQGSFTSSVDNFDIKQTPGSANLIDVHPTYIVTSPFIFSPNEIIKLSYFYANVKTSLLELLSS